MVNPRRALANQRLSRRLGAALEYVLIIALVGGGLVGAIALLANSTKRFYSRTSAAPFLPDNTPASNGVVPTPPESTPSGGGPGNAGTPPDSSGSAEPSDSSGTGPDSSGTTGTQGVGN